MQAMKLARCGDNANIWRHISTLYRIRFVAAKDPNELAVLFGHNRELDVAQGSRLTNKADGRILHGLLVLGLHYVVPSHVVKDALANCAVGAIGPYHDVTDGSVSVVLQNSDEVVTGRDREDFGTTNDLCARDMAKKNVVEDGLGKNDACGALPTHQ